MKIQFTKKMCVRKFSQSPQTARALSSALLLFLGCLAAPKTTFASGLYTDLVNFTDMSSPNYGSLPLSSLTPLGGLLYGTTFNGSSGVSNDGVLFSYNPVTNVYSALFSFTGTMAPTPGTNPSGSLLYSGSVLYGTATSGGSLTGIGVLYAYDTAALGQYSPLVEFTGTGGLFPGSQPKGPITFSSDGQLIYGTTAGGGTGGTHIYGVIYQYCIYGGSPNSYTTLYQFTNGNDGGSPNGVILSDSGTILYGVAASGTGTVPNGVIFQYNLGLGGGGYTVLFSGFGGANGATPHFLTLSGNTLYGITGQGGTGSGHGVIFQYDTLSNAYTVLYSFTGGDDGGGPASQLLVVGNLLYGTTAVGGTSTPPSGVIFQYDTAQPPGDGYSVLYSFDNITGSQPLNARLTLMDNFLYGTTSKGGSNGNIYSFGPVSAGYYSPKTDKFKGARPSLKGGGNAPIRHGKRKFK